MLNKIKKILNKSKNMSIIDKKMLEEAIEITEENIKEFEPREYHSGKEIKIGEKLLLCTLEKDIGDLEIIRVNLNDLEKRYKIIHQKDDEEQYFLRIKLLK